MAHIRKSILIDAPVDKVFNLARDPERWNSWWVGLGEAEEIRGHGEPGTMVKHQFNLAGFAFPVTSRVVEEQFTGTKGYWKGSFDGPISGAHDWNYAAVGPDQTEVTAEITYTVPGKALGKITDRLLIERMQEKAMALTMENLKLLCEAEVAAPAFA